MNGLAAIVAFLLAFFIGGPDKVEVREWRLTADVSITSAAIHLDPIFVFYSDETMKASAWTFFNAVCLNERLRGAPEEAYILHHELNHVRQFEALGWAFYPASLVLPMEWWPTREEVRWNDPAQNDAHQWIPPAWLRTWHFLTLELRLG